MSSANAHLRVGDLLITSNWTYVVVKQTNVYQDGVETNGFFFWPGRSTEWATVAVTVGSSVGSRVIR